MRINIPARLPHLINVRGFIFGIAAVMKKGRSGHRLHSGRRFKWKKPRILSERRRVGTRHTRGFSAPRSEDLLSWLGVCPAQTAPPARTLTSLVLSRRDSPAAPGIRCGGARRCPPSPILCPRHLSIQTTLKNIRMFSRPRCYSR